MPRAIEITTFRLQPELSTTDFIAANADIDPWLETQPGFVSRRICEREDGYIIDMLIWEAAESGAPGSGGRHDRDGRLAGPCVDRPGDRVLVDLDRPSCRRGRQGQRMMC
jgi:hypothetical protein